MKKLIIAATLAALSNTATAAETLTGALGLTFGQSKADIKAEGVSLDECKPNNGLDICTTKNTPKNLSVSEFNQLIFYKGDLVKIRVIGESIKADPYGTDGKQAYYNFQQALSKKYGEPTSQAESVGVRLYKESDEFYECLEYPGCGMYASVYAVEGGNIVLQLKGLQRDTGYLTFSFESNAFSTALAQIQAEKNQNDADAF